MKANLPNSPFLLVVAAALCLAELDVTLGDTIYVGAKWGNAIQKFDEHGNGSIFAAGLNYPQGMAFDSAGNLFVADYLSNRILKFDSLGRASVFFSTGLNNPQGIAFDRSGNLYVVNHWGFNILKITPQGASTVFATMAWEFPTGLAFDQQGNLFVALDSPDSIVKFDPSGNRTTFPTQNLNIPTSLVFDHQGNLFVASSGNNTIFKFDSHGNQSIFSNSGLIYPTGLTFDSHGAMYVANSWLSDNVVKIEPDGSQTVFASTLSGPMYIAIIPEPTLASLVSLGLLGIAYRTFKIRSRARRPNNDHPALSS